ncbi:hypothetical protein ACIQI7_32610 [Kitasatospora sp. NPDC092039]|uniref:hypothetical protein n=1 Tax=Kitasatospora sp. NPDC092039 TaxID=3364086 RepID=UPI0038281A6B
MSGPEDLEGTPMYAGPEIAALPNTAAQILRQFNEQAMTGPTVDPAHLAVAFDGLIQVTEYLPNALRHLHAHLLSVQRGQALADPRGRDTDELAERVRQRCHDAAEILRPLVAKLREVHTLVDGLSAIDSRLDQRAVPVSRSADLTPDRRSDRFQQA